MTSINASAVKAELVGFPDPESGRPLADTGQIVAVEASPASIAVTVGLTTHSALLWKATRGRIEERLRSRFPGVAQVAVAIVPHERPPMKLGQIGLEAQALTVQLILLRLETRRLFRELAAALVHLLRLLVDTMGKGATVSHGV